jgi:hypothetical protein
VFFNEAAYIGRVLECRNPIQPGECGEAVIGILTSKIEELDLREGSIFELRDGPKTLIATATVVSYSVE